MHFELKYNRVPPVPHRQNSYSQVNTRPLDAYISRSTVWIDKTDGRTGKTDGRKRIGPCNDTEIAYRIAMLPRHHAYTLKSGVRYLDSVQSMISPAHFAYEFAESLGVHVTLRSPDMMKHDTDHNLSSVRPQRQTWWCL